MNLIQEYIDEIKVEALAIRIVKEMKESLKCRILSQKRWEAKVRAIKSTRTGRELEEEKDNRRNRIKRINSSPMLIPYTHTFIHLEYAEVLTVEPILDITPKVELDKIGEDAKSQALKDIEKEFKTLMFL